jgi:type II secretory ATPase GspE/PulE/Tfp pilus assembly ATPase PilB-like protein
MERGALPVSQPKGLTAITYDAALRYRAIVITRDSTSATLAVTTNLDESALTALRQAVRRNDIREEVISEKDFAELLRATYPNSESATTESSLDELIKIIDHAYNTHVTDIHIERRLDGGGRIRFRRDGEIQTKLTVNVSEEVQKAYVNLVMTHANVKTDQAHPGAVWPLKLPSGRTVEIRVQILETVRDKEASLRLVGIDSRLFRLHELGMPDAIFRQLVSYIRGLEGAIVVVGPNNSGKSTLQRAIGLHVDEIKRFLSKGRTEARTVSIEMPVELQQDHTQVSLVEGTATDFAFMTKKAVRADYDYLSLGEINESNIHAFFDLALAGKLVAGSFHGRNSIGAFVRSIDMGIKLSTIDNGLRAIMACRTFPRLCPQCREPANLELDQTALFRRLLKKTPAQVYNIGNKPKCPVCAGNGTVGLKTFYELLPITPQLIAAAATRLDHASLYDAVHEDFTQMGEYVVPALEAGDINAESAITLLYAG